MGLFSKKSTPGSSYLNSALGKSALERSRIATAAGAEERRVIREEERAERAAVRREQQEEREAAERRRREERAKAAGQKAYESVMNDEEEEEEAAPTHPFRVTTHRTPRVVAADTDFPWLNLGIAAVGAVASAAILADGGIVVDDSAAREKADEIDTQATAALDEVTSSMFGNASWSEYPELCGLFRTIDATNNWRSERDECDERDSDEFSSCLRTALDGEGIVGNVSTRLMAQVSSLHHLYGKWSSTSRMFR